ncbi:MAG: GntR family transcriptional regulator [Eubacteriales bacterium]|nr:GntR family transcriptional regulator [Eubacteriales bacterium]
MHLLERYPHESGRDYAGRVIRENIIHMDLEPGASISDRELAAWMNLSRTPVREALLDLAKVKIVEIYPQRGSVVAYIDYNLVEEAQFVRSVLEEAVVQLACERADEAQLALLKENIDLQDFYYRHGTSDRLLEMDDAFHRMLFQIAGRMQAYEMMRGLTVHFDRVRSLAVTAVKEQLWMGDHRKIYEAVAARDKTEARQLMEKHLHRYKVDEAALREQYPQYFQ